MKYRSEIDGLRALAVLPVILFHAGFTVFSGGFIGVDVFFVISGYLITQIILNDISKGTFSIVRFYERRARRILPALFFVMLACIPFAYAWMVPSQHLEFSRNVIAVVTFVSNIFFWRESSYFAAEASQKPLLHTWSLGVEEQFYVLFPIALIVLWRFGKRPTMLAVAVIALISFIVCEYASRTMPSANFFLLPTRAWELMVGALCAFHHLHHAPKKNDLFAFAGFALILVAIFGYNEHMRLPSAYMVVPVFGTALVLLYATHGTWVARCLSLRMIVGIGLISYSAYLWHHPIFAFARIHLFYALNSITMILMVALSLLLAALTWYFIEQPFRHKQHRFYVKNRQALTFAVATVLMLIGVGVYGYVSHGRLAYWTKNATEQQLQAFRMIEREKIRSFDYDNGDCVFNLDRLSTEHEKRILSCYKRYGAGIAVIGDSHAMNLFHVFNTKIGDRPFMVGMAQGMCRPHSPLATCNYQPFQTLLKAYPGLFHDVIYEQVGWFMMVDTYGREIGQDALSGLPLNAPVPDFRANISHMEGTLAYLETLTPYARITWLGPRIEPEISENVIIELGCDHPFPLRPNQAEVFAALDQAIKKRLEGTRVHYRSQIDLMQFDMARDFMSCEATYWKDRNHYSSEGEKRFGERITLESVLGASDE